MAGRNQLPDLMGEALGRVRIVSSQAAPQRAASLPETPAPRSLPPLQQPIGEILQELKRMGLNGMALSLERQMASHAQHELSFEVRLRLMLQEEENQREQRRRLSRLTRARLRYPANLAEVDYQHPRGLKRERLEELAKLGWLKKGGNLIITGPVGVGKTWLACALARQACLAGHSVLYTRSSQMIRELADAAHQNKQAKKLRAFSRPALLVMDDWGWDKLERYQALDLMEVVESRHQKKSSVFISSVPLDGWLDLFWNQQLGRALLDRLLAGAEVLELHGESMRA
jgi:DNA replication protein DnaC